MTAGGRDQPNSVQPSNHKNQQRFSKWVEKQALKDNMNNSQRGGEIVGVILIGLIAFFFYAHQTESTGFFTSSFGGTEAFLLYGAILVGVAGPMSRILTGKRNKSRPPELIASVFWVIASVWFLMVVFPFNFAHVADVVPDFLAFLISWITNDIARVLLAIGMVGGIISIGINSVLYIKVRVFLLRQ
jgi:hypothetical protein